MDRRIRVCINGVEYEINANFSLNDYKIACHVKEEKNQDYKDALTKIIINHLVLEKNEKVEIEYLEEQEIYKYIDAVIQNSKRMKKKYEKYKDIEDECERFLVAANEYIEDEVKDIRESLKSIPTIDLPKISLPEIPKIQIPDKVFDYSSILPDMRAVSDGIIQISKQIMNLQSVGNTVAKSMSEIVEYQNTYIRQISDYVSKMLSQISIPSFSEEDIGKIRKALSTWGEYGWTLPPHAQLNVFFIMPENKNEADKVEDNYCKKDQMEALFTETRKISGVKISDYEEAIADYNEKRYKSCALILFS